LFDKGRSTITEHLKNIFETGELDEKAVCRDFRHTAEDGKGYTTRFYNLDAIIAVGFRVNSARAIQFRQWATGVLRDFAIRGYVLDKERLKNGAFLNKAYFDNLLDEIREIRASERRFYQKITDIYATAMDYRADAETTQTFFATVQNKLHFAIHGHTAAELVVGRADSKKQWMGLTTWKNAPHGKILKPDVSIAKNYLTEKELKSLDRFVTMYLDYAEDQAERGIPMTMKDWAAKLNAFLQFNERDILDHPGAVSQEVAKAFAESEFEMQKIIDAEKSDLFDVLAHVAYALAPLTREERAQHAKVAINHRFNSKQQAFLDFVLSHYVAVGVDQLDQEQLAPLLHLKYQDSIADAVADLGRPDQIGKVFSGFQKYLYEQSAA